MRTYLGKEGYLRHLPYITEDHKSGGETELG